MKLLVSYAYSNGPALEVRDTLFDLKRPLDEQAVDDIRMHLLYKEGHVCAIIAITKLES